MVPVAGEQGANTRVSRISQASRSRIQRLRPPSCTPLAHCGGAQRRKSKHTGMIRMPWRAARWKARSRSGNTRSSNPAGRPAGSDRIPERPSANRNHRRQVIPSRSIATKALWTASILPGAEIPPSGCQALPPKSLPHENQGRLAPCRKASPRGAAGRGSDRGARNRWIWIQSHPNTPQIPSTRFRRAFAAARTGVRGMAIPPGGGPAGVQLLKGAGGAASQLPPMSVVRTGTPGVFTPRCPMQV